MQRGPCPSSWLGVGAVVYIIHLCLWLSLTFPLCLLMVVSPSQTASNLSATDSTPTKRYVCHTFTAAICQSRGPIVAPDTSFKPSHWLIEFVYEAFIHCQTSWQRGEPSPPSSIFSRKSTLGQTCTHTHRNTHYHNAAPRGLGHPADSILFPVNGSCVTKDNLASLCPGYLRGIWMAPSLTCGLRFLCFVLGTSLPSSLSPPPWLPLCSLSSSQVVCRGCPGNLAGCPADNSPHTHPHPFRMGPLN